jgi:Flp pilus assembly protein TadD
MIFAVALVALLLAAVWWVRQRQAGQPPDEMEGSSTAAPEDPRRAYHGPFRNIHPDVQYVGDALCADCHKRMAETFRAHPMGRSMVPIAELAGQQVYDRPHNDPFDALGFRFVVDRQGERVWQRQMCLDTEGRPAFQHDVEVHYAIGSGSRGYSYVTDRDGYLFWAPVSWYSQRQIWDLSPGFDVRRLTERPLTRECLFCHANRAHPMAGYQNRYSPPIFSGHAIGCERCHGPGERHVQSVDPLDIVNPVAKRLPEPGRRDAICAQCHLEGVARVIRRGRELYDFRPGLPLEGFWSVFVHAEEKGAERAAVSHFEQMHQSRCFQRSSGDRKLTCLSCHNPHEAVSGAQRAGYYRQRCLACHGERGCRLPIEERLSLSKADSCIVCHMPRSGTADVAHTATTDHRILRHPAKSSPALNAPQPGSSFGLARFPFSKTDPKDRELKRDLSLALMHAVANGKMDPRRAGGQALFLLDAVLAAFPDDAESWEARGAAYLAQNDPRRALEALRQALARDPNNERILVATATVEHSLEQRDIALEHWRQAVHLNPWMPDYRRHLALLLLDQQAWDEVREQTREWLRLAPTRIEARMLWITCLLRQGKNAEAREEFARIEAIHPPDLEVWRKRFQQQFQK